MTPATLQIETSDIIDSRDIIERIEELEELEQTVEDARDELADAQNDLDDAVAEDRDERKDHVRVEEAKTELGEAYADYGREEDDELGTLRQFADEMSQSMDWEHGEACIREDYFTDYIIDLIDDCYEMPEQIGSGNWPWRHVKIDYEAAADEAKGDYIEADLYGITYLIRA